MGDLGDEISPEEVSAFDTRIAVAAYAVSRKYAEFIELDEVRQHLWLWVMRTQRRINKWREANEDEDYEHLLGAVLYDEANIFARRAKATALGYKASDEFFYTKNLIIDLLPVMFDRDEWLTPPTEHGNGKSGKALNEGSNWLATMADISQAFARLERGDKELLTRAFRDDETLTYLAQDYGITSRGVDKRIERAVKRLWSLLGGPKWLEPEQKAYHSPENYVGARKVMSNAHARAITDQEYSA